MVDGVVEIPALKAGRIGPGQAHDLFVVVLAQRHVGEILHGPRVGEADAGRQIHVVGILAADVFIHRGHDAVVALGEVIEPALLEDGPQGGVALGGAVVFVEDGVDVVLVAGTVLVGPPALEKQGRITGGATVEFVYGPAVAHGGEASEAAGGRDDAVFSLRHGKGPARGADRADRSGGVPADAAEFFQKIIGGKERPQRPLGEGFGVGVIHGGAAGGVVAPQTDLARLDRDAGVFLLERALRRSQFDDGFGLAGSLPHHGEFGPRDEADVVVEFERRQLSGGHGIAPQNDLSAGFAVAHQRHFTRERRGEEKQTYQPDETHDLISFTVSRRRCRIRPRSAVWRWPENSTCRDWEDC